MSGQPDWASTCSQTVSLLAIALCGLALAVAARSPSSTATMAGATTRSLMQLSSSRRRASRSGRIRVAGGDLRADWYVPLGHGRVIAHRTGPCQGGVCGAPAELGDDAVAVATVDRVDELDGPSRLVARGALEEERRRVERDAERLGLLLVRHRRLDRLGAARRSRRRSGREQVVERPGRGPAARARARARPAGAASRSPSSPRRRAAVA